MAYGAEMLLIYACGCLPDLIGLMVSYSLRALGIVKYIAVSTVITYYILGISLEFLLS